VQHAIGILVPSQGAARSQKRRKNQQETAEAEAFGAMGSDVVVHDVEGGVHKDKLALNLGPSRVCVAIGRMGFVLNADDSGVGWGIIFVWMNGRKWAGIVVVMVALTGCTYDDLETLGSPLDCGTVEVSYGMDILPMVADHCQGCHAGASPSAGIGFENHGDIFLFADIMLDRMDRDAGDSELMPQSGKLDSCSIARFNAWIAAGKPNN
jgi:hypothetical protein